MQQRIADVVRDRFGVVVPRCGAAVKIIRKQGLGGQVQATYKGTLEEGFLYTNPGRGVLSFEPWVNVERFEEDKA